MPVFKVTNKSGNVSFVTEYMARHLRRDREYTVEVIPTAEELAATKSADKEPAAKKSTKKTSAT